MPFADVGREADPIRLHYRTDGDAARPCLVLAHALGTDLHLWDAQAAALSSSFHVVRYDARGHGQSTRAPGPVAIADLGRDALDLLDRLGIARAVFCGISMGGLAGQWLGVHAPERIAGLVLANTAARIGTAAGWKERAAQARAHGLAAIADASRGRWFTPEFLARAPDEAARVLDTLRRQDPETYAACCEMLARTDLRGQVGRIAAPALVVAGEHDPTTTVEDAAWLADHIPHAHMISLPAAHLSNVGAASAFTGALRGFLED
jgi:3-oxoadipate enol-lactonase